MVDDFITQAKRRFDVRAGEVDLVQKKVTTRCCLQHIDVLQKVGNSMIINYVMKKFKKIIEHLHRNWNTEVPFRCGWRINISYMSHINDVSRAAARTRLPYYFVMCPDASLGLKIKHFYRK